jgi:CRP-like cAMP-binding protein
MHPAPGFAKNQLLAALPPEELAHLAPHLEVVELQPLEIIAHSGEPLPHAYFPLSGILSIVAIDGDGGTVEVGTVGHEGVVGLPSFLGAPASPFQTMGQVPGQHARLPMGRLLAAAVPGTALHALLLRYAQAYYILAGQSAACNRLHSMEERCARWLLLTHDRVARDSFLLTQDVLAQMLGVRRPNVTIAAGILQKAGFITYRRGVITILDRGGLEAAACECYGIVQAAFAAILAAPVPQ